MWEFLIKQESGLYKPKSVAELDFIEQYYGFQESQSNPDALLGERLPFEYNGTSVSFVNESSLTDTGTYLTYAQINATNDSVMTASAGTVAQAKIDLLDAINSYGEKLVRVIHVSTDIPYQPLPGGVSPADLALKQDKILETPVVINHDTQTTVQDALTATQFALLASNPSNSNRIYVAPGTNDANDHYYLLGDFSSLTAIATFQLSGYIGCYTTGKLSRIEALILINPDDNIYQLQGYYDKELDAGCDILLTSDGQIYIQVNGAAKYCEIMGSGSLLLSAPSTYSTTAPANVSQQLSVNGINLSAGGGGGGGLSVPIISVEVDP